MNKITLLYTCDIWKSWSNARVRGIFTDREELNKAIKFLIEDDIIELNENCGFTIDDIPDMSLKELHNSLDFAMVVEYKLNKLY